MKNRFVIDMHCHPNLRPFNSGHPEPVYNLWDNVRTSVTYPDSTFAALIKPTIQKIHKDSQSNLENLKKGNVRVAVVSLYPVEKGFFTYRTIPKVLFGNDNINKLYEYISGVHPDRLAFLQQSPDGYFTLLNQEYRYIYNQQGTAPDGKTTVKLVKDYHALKSTLEADEDAIVLILSIEGAHAFGCGCPATFDKPENELKKELTRNIRQVKSWEYPPFYINLSHHFWNQLCGHAPSIKSPVNKVLNQRTGMHFGFTETGKHVLNELLSDENGKPIYIDIKHMSVRGRMEYYRFLEEYRKKTGRKIPVIVSHTGVNGFKTMAESIRQQDTMWKCRKSYFHNWSINLSDEEINIIYRSEGIIGIMMDKGLLGGTSTVANLLNIPDESLRREGFAKLIWDTIFQIIQAIGDKHAWDIVTIGSDYDGGISHIDHYPDASTFHDLQKDLTDYLYKYNYRNELWYGYEPEELMDKIMYANALAFFEKYFH